MDYRISHKWEEETDAAKVRWFKTLTPEERLQYFFEMYEFLVSIRPDIVEKKKDAVPIPGRVQVITLPRG